ncbi:MAG: 2-oxoglutarate oxidoreductase [Gemmatimonadota bacterium]|nr:MAG: 2-oxoglutarate oxidoreductase [Gemmatimonadota bacterium]
MTHYGCSLLSCGVIDERTFEMDDYQGAVARWCPGCGDHSILTAVQRLLEEEQLKPEETVFVSGIGCSSRFPHYLNTYGFHGLHGRALPVATGVKLERPELNVFVVMGDGDCCSIGAGHWIHATRYNVDMVALLLDNNMYGLTKGQTSPTTPLHFPSNTQPRGTYLEALNPVQATLGVTNASFVAQTAEWIPAHLYETLKAAYHHKGFSFVRILQRCPVYTASVYDEAVRKPDVIEMMVHDDGIYLPDLDQIYKQKIVHNPKDIDGARRLAEVTERVRLGVFYRNEALPRYEDLRRLPAHTAEERVRLLSEELDRYAV